MLRDDRTFRENVEEQTPSEDPTAYMIDTDSDERLRHDRASDLSDVREFDTDARGGQRGQSRATA
jgi:hypothetical protein